MPANNDAAYQRSRAEYLLARIADLGGPASQGGTVYRAVLSTELRDAGTTRVETHSYFDAEGNAVGAATWIARKTDSGWEGEGA